MERKVEKSNIMVRLDRNDFPAYFRQTLDYVFLDVVEVEPGERADGYLKLVPEAWYFPMHFPGNPVLPGVFQMECLQQTGGLILNTMEGRREERLYFYACQDVRIHRKAVPGDCLHAEVSLLRFRRGIAKFQGTLYVNDAVSCQMQFALADPDEVSVL